MYVQIAAAARKTTPKQHTTCALYKSDHGELTQKPKHKVCVKRHELMLQQTAEAHIS